MKKGYIYIMTNPSFPDKVKIGFTCDVEQRRRQLSRTNVPDEYEVYATYETSGNLEDKKLHHLIDKLNKNLRYTSKKEFYVMSPEYAYDLLEAIATISGTLDKLILMKKPVKAKSRQKTDHKRPAVNFSECGIPVGAELIFIDDNTVRCTVVGDHKVKYGDNITSLSAIAKDIKGYSVAGPSCFTYKGKTIADIATETQWKDFK